MSKKLTADATAAALAPASFEEAMAELAQLVAQMEAGQLPLEASVAAYARGSELVKFCAAQLEKWNPRSRCWKARCSSLSWPLARANNERRLRRLDEKSPDCHREAETAKAHRG